ncbi:chloride anion exchanger isoform X2 [Callorhinchus milii]|uniref:Solute carrier family 26 member 3, tandem duplicate 2 n=1 Tax=Callorhinchus milii TaxID=7868 RepID=A0A4W3HSQ2_CALMI|nr:chloride anion exchanger isoform X2 [Callorhinchus milii]|eukprot:gi/632981985/ref/XP_007907887.1/ PREDICTED: chloride anion exchanger isoform X2 [Callorhinchus milii]
MVMSTMQAATRYNVARSAYSENTFKRDNQKMERYHKTPVDHFQAYFSCSVVKAKRIFYTLFPVASWLPTYNFKDWLVSDIISGISTGLVAVLQGLAFALLVSVPPGYGLYAAFFPVLTYFLFGTSKHLSVGPFPVVSLMVGTVVDRLVVDGVAGGNSTIFPEGMSDEDRKVWVATSVTYLAGIFQTLEYIFNNIPETNITDLVTSIIVILIVFIVKEINDRYKSKLPVPIPIEVIMTVIATGVSYAFSFEERYQVDIVGNITSGFQTPLTPNAAVLEDSIIDAFSIAIVGFTVAFSVAKVYSIKHDYTINGNQELIAFGISNIFCGAFRGFAGSTALSRTAVQESTGGKSQIASLVSALLVMIVLLAIGYLLAPLQKSVLGALVVVNLKGMFFQFREVVVLWKKDKYDCLVWLVSFVAAVLLGLDLGLAAGVAFELLTVVFRTQFSQFSVLANINGTDIYRNRKDYQNIYEPEGLKIFRCPSPIFFANINSFRDKLIEVLGFNPLRILRKRNRAVLKIRKLLKKGEIMTTLKGYMYTPNASYTEDSSEDEDDNNNIENLDKPVEMKDLPLCIDWNRSLPGNLQVPGVDTHSVVFDFAAVSFLDVSAINTLKGILKELVRIEIDIYIAACDDLIIEKLEKCGFFDDEINTNIFFITIHDAILHILGRYDPEKTNYECDNRQGNVYVDNRELSNGELKKRDYTVRVETKF